MFGIIYTLLIISVSLFLSASLFILHGRLSLDFEWEIPQKGKATGTGREHFALSGA